MMMSFASPSSKSDFLKGSKDIEASILGPGWNSSRLGGSSAHFRGTQIRLHPRGRAPLSRLELNRLNRSSTRGLGSGGRAGHHQAKSLKSLLKVS